jgi:hypothetical protein
MNLVIFKNAKGADMRHAAGSAAFKDYKSPHEIVSGRVSACRIMGKL